MRSSWSSSNCCGYSQSWVLAKYHAYPVCCDLILYWHITHARSTMLDIPLSSLHGSRAWEEREPGAHCSRKCQVPLVTCILFRYTKIMVNFFLPAKGSTASWDPYRQWILIWRNLFGLHLCTEFQLANCACASGWSCLMNLDLQESNGRFRVAGLVHWNGGAYCVSTLQAILIFFMVFTLLLE